MRDAREFVIDVLEGEIDDEACADVALALSELATNAVKHAQTPFEVVVEADRRVRIQVEDRSPQRPVLRDAGPTDTNGRGLALVATLCDRWGVHVMGDAKCVWCELDLSS